LLRFGTHAFFKSTFSLEADGTGKVNNAGSDEEEAGDVPEEEAPGDVSTFQSRRPLLTLAKKLGMNSLEMSMCVLADLFSEDSE